MSISLSQPNRAVVTDAVGNLTTSTITSTQLGYLKGTTSNVQDQLDDASFNFVRLYADWESNAATLSPTPFTFVPKPLRTYAVDAHMYVLGNATNYSQSLGIRWPTSLYNANAGGATLAYTSSGYASGGFANTAIMRTSSQITDPFITLNNATFANVPAEVSVQALFVTSASGNTSPFSILANVNDASRAVKILYGSHLTYRSFPSVPVPP